MYWFIKMIFLCLFLISSQMEQAMSESPGAEITMSITPAEMRQGFTEDMELRCVFQPQPGSVFKVLNSMTLSKSLKNEVYSELAAIAMGSQVASVKESLGADVTGNIFINGVSYINFKWRLPSDDVIGQYRCEAHGADSFQHPVVVTASAVVTRKAINEDLLLEKIKNLEQALDKNNAQLQEQKVHLTAQINEQKTQLDQQTAKIDLQKTQLDTKINQQKALLSEHRTQLDQQNNLLNQQGAQVDLQKTQVNSLIVQQKSLLGQQGARIDRQKTQLTAEIDHQKTLLNQQGATINEQKNQLNRQIHHQNMLLSQQGEKIDQQETNFRSMIDQQNALLTEQGTKINQQKKQLDQQKEWIKNHNSTLGNVTKLLESAQYGVMMANGTYRGHQYLLTRPYYSTHVFRDLTCRLFGGHLAEIDDEEEFQFVRNFLRTTARVDRVYISGSDLGQSLKWTHQRTGKELTYTNWRTEEPNRHTGWKCIGLYGKYDWKMFDPYCSYKFLVSFLCEIPSPIYF